MDLFSRKLSAITNFSGTGQIKKKGFYVKLLTYYSFTIILLSSRFLAISNFSGTIKIKKKGFLIKLLKYYYFPILQNKYIEILKMKTILQKRCFFGKPFKMNPLRKYNVFFSTENPKEAKRILLSPPPPFSDRFFSKHL